MNNLVLIILFLSPVLSGLAYFLVKPDHVTQNFKVLLTFAGAYLFSITLIHLIPELFEMAFEQYHHQSHELLHGNLMKIGVYILAGFFLQKVLEFFSSGIEHGHIHLHRHGHGQSPYVLLIALCIHSLIEGTILNHASVSDHGHSSYDLLLGIVFHKAPAAFILMMLFMNEHMTKVRAIALLLLFSVASPVGMILGDLLIHEDGELYIILYALVTGNLLHIATTIFIESSPEHKIEQRKIVAILVGVGMAFLTVAFH